ncbi:hypothetical protein SteCoe_11979 [Stentor coeruleus]|uniref:Transcription factor 25 n=1 Tax=Stentor coeruleus TaxID=5963 RepID=A0A1R2CBW4_9CILI|nr:hypothetical protein SteCoe_11979 [Stentor coeruleus]
MSNRQTKRILQQNSTKKPETQGESSDSEEEIVKKPNLFQNFEVESIESESQSDSEPIVSTRNVGKNDVKEKNIESLEDILKSYSDPTTEPVKAQEKSDPVFKKSVKNFDPDEEKQKIFKEDRKKRKSNHKSGKKLALTPNFTYQGHIDYLLSMEKIPDPSKNIFFFDISKGYSKIHPNYIECIETNDANSLNQFLHRYPFHVEALYQMAMVFLMQGNYEQVSSMVERLLYVFQISFHYQFSVLSMDAEIDITHNNYNRIFYKTLMMHVDCLGRKGCVRAALEVVKFIFSLNPTKDQTGCIFLIDYYSIRAKKFHYFYHFIKNFMKEIYGYGNFLVFPHLLYSLAFAKASESGSFTITEDDFIKAKNLDKSEELFDCPSGVCLAFAVSWKPEYAWALLNKLGSLDKDQKPLEIGKIHEIYTSRTEDIWKPQVAWLRKAFLMRKEAFDYDPEFEDLAFRYNTLEKSEFSFDVRTVIPPEMEVGRPRSQGNLNPNAHPIYLFFATLLPWNYVD